jgi:hypothetical protein
MSRYVIWDKRATIVTPVGEVLTPQQWIDRYPAAGIEGIRYIVGGGIINGNVMMEYNATIEHYARQGCDFTGCETERDFLDAIEAFEDYVPEDTGESSPEERIAAALEYNNLLASNVIHDDDPDEGEI